MVQYLTQGFAHGKGVAAKRAARAMNGSRGLSAGIWIDAKGLPPDAVERIVIASGNELGQLTPRSLNFVLAT